MDDTEVRITLRLPGSLRDRLLEAADKNSRSMNGEIVARLEDSFSIGELEKGPIFNIVLDAKGYPLDWPQIAAHIHRTAKAAGLHSVGFKAAIFNAGKPVDDPFAKEYMRLIRWYQKRTREHKNEIRSGAVASKSAGNDTPDEQPSRPRKRDDSDLT